jgi:hypothetical protein
MAYTDRHIGWYPGGRRNGDDRRRRNDYEENGRGRRR